MSGADRIAAGGVTAHENNRPPKIEIHGIERIFLKKNETNGAQESFVALKDVNLKVESGEFVTVVGPSGCGKSTLLFLLSGLASPSRGEILINGDKVTGPALNCGIVLQGYALFPWRSVRKNIEFGLELKSVPKKERKEISDYYINLVDLTGFENHYPYQLSGGMQQRVAIARVLAYDPDVLLMDEPFAAVDAQTRETMQDELLNIWEKTQKTIVLVTHNIEEAIGLADRVAVMSRNPGTIRDVVPVNLPRPRRIGGVRNTPDFQILSHHIWELLQDKGSRGGSGAQSAAVPRVDIGEHIRDDAVI
ncbi:MAG: ABC transporter ATP-binding protein [Clostridiales Family XIII bacterium]|jgi:NitT/TauT family transport system ATP-binding protein|nr:ABC transporter ATP-binding protein [Clostridiales Family XIII bacterium]